MVDNTPNGTNKEYVAAGGCILLSDGVNKGLGAALNIGIEHAINAGADYLVLFDQDSEIAPDYFKRIQDVYAELAASSVQPVGAVAPTFCDDQTGRLNRGVRQKYKQTQNGAVPVSALATSGMLIPVSVFKDVGGFDEKLFLDFVDFEWCWRATQKGYALYRTERVVLTHRLGEGQRTFLGLQYHIPADFRHYFQFRDTLNVFFNSAAPIYDRFRLMMLLPIKFIVYPFILDKGWQRFVWMCRGIRDYFRRVHGAGAASVRICK